MDSSLVKVLCFLQLLLISIQQKNLAPNGQSTQSITYPAHSPIYHSVLAIDNDNDTCAITAQFQTYAWWMLTFPSTAFITYVTMIYRPLTLARFANYSLHITNSSVQSGQRPDGLCYQHNVSTPNPLEERVCYGMLGKNVIVYNVYKDPTPFMELCDVKVYGCYKGWTGPDCGTLCPFNCLSSNCYPENGTCVWGCNAKNCLNDSCNFDTGVCEEGCKPGYRGLMCNRFCEAGNFGLNCSEICDSCFEQPCDPFNGTCSASGCNKGYKGSKCDTECSGGSYGYNCNETCSGCVSTLCDRFDGICYNRTHCNPGWLGEKCNRPCSSGTFGGNCSKECHCTKQPCNHITGNCPQEGCDLGYYGINCDLECTNGHYGADCDETCSGCVYDECDRFNGVCTNNTHCKLGWVGEKCNQPCSSGTFGRNCLEECHCTNQPCNQITGACPPGGCDRGYFGSNCDKECSRGQYGYNCNETCDGCASDLCNIFNGECDIKWQCKPGWLGLKCNKPCDAGKFGLNCSDVCHCLTHPCNHETGDCPPEGCQPGYHGKACSTECKTGSYGHNCAKSCKTCYNSLCERYAGICTSGCIDGYWGRECQFSCISEAVDRNYAVVVGVICSTAVVIAIIVAVIVILRRRSGSPQTKSNEQRRHGQPDTAFYDGFVMSDQLRRENPYAELDSKTVVGKQTNRMEIEDRCTLENSQGQTYVNLGY